MACAVTPVIASLVRMRTLAVCSRHPFGFGLQVDNAGAGGFVAGEGEVQGVGGGVWSFSCRSAAAIDTRIFVIKATGKYY